VTLSYFRGYDDARASSRASGCRIGDRSRSRGARPRLPRLTVAGSTAKSCSRLGDARRGRVLPRPGGRAGRIRLFQVEAEWSSGPWRAIAVRDTLAAARRPSRRRRWTWRSFRRCFSADATERPPSAGGARRHRRTNEFDALVRLSGSYPFAGHVRAGAEIDLIGAIRHVLGRWRDNDRLRLFSASTSSRARERDSPFFYKAPGYRFDKKKGTVPFLAARLADAAEDETRCGRRTRTR